MANPQLSGACLCGAVTYSVDADPVIVANCHCTDCQKQTGSAFSTVVGVPAAAMAISGDSLRTHVTVGTDRGEDANRKFCSQCGSPIASFIDGEPAMAYIKSGTLDDTSWLSPVVDVWCESRQPWVDSGDRATLPRGPG